MSLHRSLCVSVCPTQVCASDIHLQSEHHDPPEFIACIGMPTKVKKFTSAADDEGREGNLTRVRRRAHDGFYVNMHSV